MKRLVPILKKIKVGGQSVDLEKLINGDYDNVAEAAQELPGAISWLGWERGIQYARVEALKRRVKEAEANAYFDLKAGQFESRGYGAKPTDAALRHAITLDEAVQAASEDLENGQKWLNIMNGQLEGLRAKLEMVRTSEATRRRLIEGVPDEALKQPASTNPTEDEET